MVNINLSYNKTIPQELLYLFYFYKENIIDNPFLYNNYQVNEASEEYEILNTKKSDKTFNELLFEYIEKVNITDVELYKKANVDRRIFSKIRSNTNYHPSFGTITLLSLALHLSCKDYEYLLKSASYSLPQNSYINITIKYCFDKKIFDINRIDEILYAVSGKIIKEL